MSMLNEKLKILDCIFCVCIKRVQRLCVYVPLFQYEKMLVARSGGGSIQILRSDTAM